MHQNQSCHPGSRPVEGEHRRSLDTRTRRTEASCSRIENDRITNDENGTNESEAFEHGTEWNEREKRARIRPSHTTQEDTSLTTLLALEATLLEATLLAAVCCQLTTI